MLNVILAYLRNYFPARKWYGTYDIKNGTLVLPDLQNGQYFRIIGSVFNDGVHRYPAGDLIDEVFSGALWALAVPKDLVNLVDEIEAWQESNGEKVAGPFQSESFGGYSYTMKSNAGEPVTSWQSAFEERLNIWRKI